MKKIHDISWPISPEMTAYKNKSTVKFQETKQFARDDVRESVVTLSTHTGTHVDAPAHFMEHGKTIDQLSLQQLVGPCQVIAVPTVDGAITRDDLARHTFHEQDIVLFKTINSLKKPDELFDADFVYLDASAAAYLVEQKVKAVGIDYLGIERNQPNHETHLTLMKADIAIVEGLRLTNIKPGRYFFVCLPIALTGLEAAPARAMLIEE